MPALDAHMHQYMPMYGPALLHTRKPHCCLAVPTECLQATGAEKTKKNFASFRRKRRILHDRDCIACLLHYYLCCCTHVQARAVLVRTRTAFLVDLQVNCTYCLPALPAAQIAVRSCSACGSTSPALFESSAGLVCMASQQRLKRCEGE